MSFYTDHPAGKSGPEVGDTFAQYGKAYTIIGSNQRGLFYVRHSQTTDVETRTLPELNQLPYMSRSWPQPIDWIR